MRPRLRHVLRPPVCAGARLEISRERTVAGPGVEPRPPHECLGVMRKQVVRWSRPLSGWERVVWLSVAWLSGGPVCVRACAPKCADGDMAGGDATDRAVA